MTDRLFGTGKRGARCAPRGSVLAAGLGFAAAALVPTGATGQLASSAVSAAAVSPRIFLDCQGQVPCDRTHFRTELQWVNWMNDREDADVHVILTGEPVGGGGRRFTLDFIGRGTMEALTDRLTYTSSGTDVQIETLEGITQALRVGLVRYAAESGLGNTIDIGVSGPVAVAAADQDGSGPPAAGGAAQSPFDPWNYWTFRMGLSGNMSIEESRGSWRVNPTFGADRVTENWKINFSASYNVNREKIELSDRTVRNDRDSWNSNSLIARSISGHVSTGVDFGAGNSVQDNRKARVTVTPAVEWNYYPYVEANRRQLIAMYGAGIQYNRYAEETVFQVMEETVPLHRFQLQYRAVEGWGNAGLSLDASQYLHEGGLYSFGASANVSFRVARGLEVSISGSGDKIADQIHIPASDISEEDILLGRRALPTGYSLQASVGLNYRWGSSFSNVVNTRFPSLSGGPGAGGGGQPPGGGRGGGGPR